MRSDTDTTNGLMIDSTGARHRFARPPRRRSRSLERSRDHAAHNPEGNSRLTAMLGDLILPLFVVAFITALQAKSGLLTVHVAVGLVLGGLVGVKLASVTYRMAAYYRGVAVYRKRGRPANYLRLLGGSLGVLCVMLFGSGVVLLMGPSSLHSSALAVHKATGYLTVVAIVLHLIAHLRSALAIGTGDLRRRALSVPGARARWSLLASTLAIGAVIAVLLTSHASTYAHRYYPHPSLRTAGKSLASARAGGPRTSAIQRLNDPPLTQSCSAA